MFNDVLGPRAAVLLHFDTLDEPINVATLRSSVPELDNNKTGGLCRQLVEKGYLECKKLTARESLYWISDLGKQRATHERENPTAKKMRKYKRKPVEPVPAPPPTLTLSAQAEALQEQFAALIARDHQITEMLTRFHNEIGAFLYGDANSESN